MTAKINKWKHFDLLGEVSGATKATPSAEAARWAPDLKMKFSSVHVRPERKYKTYYSLAAR